MTQAPDRLFRRNNTRDGTKFQKDIGTVGLRTYSEHLRYNTSSKYTLRDDLPCPMEWALLYSEYHYSEIGNSHDKDRVCPSVLTSIRTSDGQFERLSGQDARRVFSEKVSGEALKRLWSAPKGALRSLGWRGYVDYSSGWTALPGPFVTYWACSTPLRRLVQPSKHLDDILARYNECTAWRANYSPSWAALAEFERKLIRARCDEGIKRAKATRYGIRSQAGARCRGEDARSLNVFDWRDDGRNWQGTITVVWRRFIVSYNQHTNKQFNKHNTHPHPVGVSLFRGSYLYCSPLSFERVVRLGVTDLGRANFFRNIMGGTPRQK